MVNRVFEAFRVPMERQELLETPAVLVSLVCSAILDSLEIVEYQDRRGSWVILEVPATPDLQASRALRVTPDKSDPSVRRTISRFCA